MHCALVSLVTGIIVNRVITQCKTLIHYILCQKFVIGQAPGGITYYGIRLAAFKYSPNEAWRNTETFVPRLPRITLRSIRATFYLALYLPRAVLQPYRVKLILKNNLLSIIGVCPPPH